MTNSKTVPTMPCPLCGYRRGHKTNVTQVYNCAKCGALHGECYKGDSYGLVLPMFDTQPQVVEEKYFDLLVIGSEGVSRRHGWYNPQTKRITQVG